MLGWDILSQSIIFEQFKYFLLVIIDEFLNIYCCDAFRSICMFWIIQKWSRVMGLVFRLYLSMISFKKFMKICFTSKSKNLFFFGWYCPTMRQYWDRIRIHIYIYIYVCVCVFLIWHKIWVWRIKIELNQQRRKTNGTLIMLAKRHMHLHIHALSITLFLSRKKRKRKKSKQVNLVSNFN